MIGARICSTWGCERAVHSIGRSTCCSACSVGRHTRRCQRNVKEALRMSITECTTEGCVLPVGYGHTNCCSTCRRSWGRLHTDRCHGRLPQAQQTGAEAGGQPAARASGASSDRGQTAILVQAAASSQACGADTAGNGTADGTAAFSSRAESSSALVASVNLNRMD